MSASVKKLLRNIFANQMGFAVSIVVTFFLSPFVVDSLGGTRYGIWSLIVSLTGNYGLLAFGIQGAMNRYIAHAAATGDRERVNGYFNSALLFLAGSAALSLIVGGIVALLIDRIFVLPGELVDEARKACLLVTLSAAATFAFAAFDSILISHHRFQLINAIGTAGTLIRAALTVLLLREGHGIVALAALGTGLALLNGLLAVLIVRSQFDWIEVSASFVRKGYLEELVKYGYKSFTVAIALTLIYQCDLMVIGANLDPDKVTAYSLAATVITYFIQLVATAVTAMNPFATELVAQNKEQVLREFFISASRVMYMLGGAVVAGGIVWGESFFTLWVGPKYAGSAVILTILIIPQFFSTGARVGSCLLSGMASVGPLAAAALCQGVGNICLSLYLVKDFGVIGVAIGTFVPLVIADAVWLPVHVCRVASLKWSSIYLKSMLPGGVVLLSGLASGLLIRSLLPPLTWSVWVLDSTAAAFFCLLISYLIAARTGSRATLKPDWLKPKPA